MSPLPLPSLPSHSLVWSQVTITTASSSHPGTVGLVEFPPGVPTFHDGWRWEQIDLCMIYGHLIAWDVSNYAENRTRQTWCRKQFSRIIERTCHTRDSSILPPGGYPRAERLVKNNHLGERPWVQTPNQGKPQTNLQPPRSFRRATPPPELLFPPRDPYSNYCRSCRSDSSPASWRFFNWTIACLWLYLFTGVCLT